MKRPRILVSNDDGIFSGGIRALVRELRSFAEVTVVAPNAQQSAVGHALTVALPLRAERYEYEGEFFGWAVSGTPADCVKLAMTHLLDEPPDLLISGINHGRNTAISLVYSGTVSGATEGTMLGIPSVAISLDDFAEDADFSSAARVAKTIAHEVMRKGLPPGVLLNVNVPAIPEDKIRGIRLARQGDSFWNDRFERRTDPMGRPYFWLTGTYELSGDETDDHAVNDGYVSVTPIHYRLTDEAMLERMRGWDLDQLDPLDGDRSSSDQGSDIDDRRGDAP